MDNRAIVAVNDLQHVGRIGVEIPGRQTGESGNRAADEVVSRRLRSVAEDDVGHAIDEPPQFALAEAASAGEAFARERATFRATRHPSI